MAEPAPPVLLLTRSPALWQHWQALRSHGWLVQHGSTLDDWRSWRAQGRRWVLLDAQLPGLPAWGARALTPEFDGMRVLVLSSHPSDDEGMHALQQGASGYAHAALAPLEIDRILQAIAQGAIWTGRSLLQRLLHGVATRLPPPPARASAAWADALTPRERAVAELAALGKGNQEIADALAITERTVRAHLSAAFEKMQVSDRLQLALKVHGIGA